MPDAPRFVFDGSPEDTAFRASLGLPPYTSHTTREWVLRWRANKACELIRSLWLTFLLTPGTSRRDAP